MLLTLFLVEPLFYLSSTRKSFAYSNIAISASTMFLHYRKPRFGWQEQESCHGREERGVARYGSRDDQHGNGRRRERDDYDNHVGNGSREGRGVGDGIGGGPGRHRHGAQVGRGGNGHDERHCARRTCLACRHGGGKEAYAAALRRQEQQLRDERLGLDSPYAPLGPHPPVSTVEGAGHTSVGLGPLHTPLNPHAPLGPHTPLGHHAPPGPNAPLSPYPPTTAVEGARHTDLGFGAPSAPDSPHPPVTAVVGAEHVRLGCRQCSFIFAPAGLLDENPEYGLRVNPMAPSLPAYGPAEYDHPAHGPSAYHTLARGPQAYGTPNHHLHAFGPLAPGPPSSGPTAHSHPSDDALARGLSAYGFPDPDSYAHDAPGTPAHDIEAIDCASQGYAYPGPFDRAFPVDDFLVMRMADE
ncbi:MAG: hypothetical protein Q9183_003239 [Haloplaca sp. 2 TL-2023]